MVARPLAGPGDRRLAQAAEKVARLALPRIELEGPAEGAASVGAIAGGEERLAEGEIARGVPRILVHILLEERYRALRLSLVERLGAAVEERLKESLAQRAASVPLESAREGGEGVRVAAFARIGLGRPEKPVGIVGMKTEVVREVGEGQGESCRAQRLGAACSTSSPPGSAW